MIIVSCFRKCSIDLIAFRFGMIPRKLVPAEQNADGISKHNNPITDLPSETGVMNERK